MGKSRAIECVVVDDEAAILCTLVRMLQALGCVATACESPKSLAELSKNARLILLDLSLRDGDAVEALRYLKTQNYRGAVALMSGHDCLTLERVQKIGVDYGLHMSEYLRKPVRKADLQRLLGALADTHSAVEPPPAAHEARVARHSSRLFQSAFERGHLELWHQPKVSLADGAIVGFEALVRLRHPKRGVLTPDQFLPRAGDVMHIDLAEFVVEHAVSHQPKLAAAGLPTRIAVNVPLVALRSEKFLAFLRTIMQRGAAPNLTAEITEDEALSDAGQVYESALQLRLMGVDLSIDDFGTGYSSLARMCDLPFSEVKLDRRFVSGCAGDHLKRGICQTVIDLAHRFEAKVVAEGVENWDDLATLARMRCDHAQGYLLGKPMPLDQVLSAHAALDITPPALAQRLLLARSSSNGRIRSVG